MLIDWYHKINSEDGRVSKVTTSLPRDCLQAERSLLQYCKFAGTLGFASLAVLLDFKFVHTDSSESLIFLPSLNPSRFSMGLGIVFFILSVSSLVLGAINYFSNIKNIFEGHTQTGPRGVTNIFVFFVVLCLFAINVTLLVDSSQWTRKN